MLLENGNRVFGVEPNVEMRAAGDFAPAVEIGRKAALEDEERLREGCHGRRMSPSVKCTSVSMAKARKWSVLALFVR